MFTQDIFEKGLDLARKTSFIPRQNFSDSGIIFKSSPGCPVRKIAVGIDVETPELLLAKARHCDLVIAHHPVGAPLVGIAEEVNFHVENLHHYGIPKKNVSKFIDVSVAREKRHSMADNIAREAQVAEIFELDLIVLHTPMDIIGVSLMENTLKKKSCQTLRDCLKILQDLEEFRLAEKFGQTPFIAHGEPNAKIGRISFTEFLGAEESSPEIFKPLKNAGVDTILVPHFSEDFFRAATAAGLQIIYCGHMASDSMGPNAFLNSLLLENPTIEILPLGGFLRTSARI